MGEWGGRSQVPCPLLDVPGNERSGGGPEEKDPCCFVGYGGTGNRGACVCAPCHYSFEDAPNREVSRDIKARLWGKLSTDENTLHVWTEHVKHLVTQPICKDH